ncbi:MAG TPA: MCP four helix bundle domain-containing protein [Myxococcota bacterium]|nr:MCP four helix bundle domain-containing protein [Myxococcota bacterium]
MKHMLLITVFFAFLILLFVVFEAVLHQEISHLAGLVETAIDHPMAVTRGAMAAGLDLTTINRDIRDLIMVNDPSVQKARLVEIEDRDKYAQLNIDLVASRVLDDDGRAMIKSVSDLAQQEKKLRAKIMALILSGNTAAASHLAHTESLPLNDKIQDILFKLTFYAESKSKHFVMDSLHVQRQAKVILVCMGFIIFILILLFIAVMIISLNKALKKTGVAITRASEKPIDLVTKLHASSLSFINVAFNQFLNRVNEQVQEVINLSQALQSALRQSPVESGLSSAITLNINKIESLGQKSSRAMESYQYQNKHHGKIIDILHQIRGDLVLSTQIAGGLGLLIEQLKLNEEIAGADRTKLIDKLSAHSRTLVEQIERSSSSIDGAVQLIESFMGQTAELGTFFLEYMKLGIDLHGLENMSRVYETKLSHIKDVSEKLDKSLQAFNMGQAKSAV